MRGTRRTPIVITSFVALMLCGPSAAIAQPQAFAGGYAHPTNGRVGYHMVSQFSFGSQPCKSGEHMTPADITVAGTVPPGLTSPGFGGNGTPYFEGTPRQAGDWHVVATLHNMRCNPAPGVVGQVDYGDSVVPVDFHIDP